LKIFFTEVIVVPEWTFITKHAVVLSIIAKNPRITGLELARELGVTERAARKLIAELHENGYITKKKEGRRVRYSINPDQPLRQDTHSDIPVGSLLETLGWKRKSRKASKNEHGIN
jgi:predicted DNA-binding transcriptional regulator YafY